MNATVRICPCGRPLHYRDPRIEALMHRNVERYGPTLVVKCGERIFRVSRHYIALHGLGGPDLDRLAQLGIIEELTA